MKKLLSIGVVVLTFGAQAMAQINAQPPELRRNYVTPQEMVSMSSNTPFNQAITILDTYSKRYLNKIIIDPENRKTPIGVNVDRMQWLDALDAILRANGLWYKEYESYIQIVSAPQEGLGQQTANAAASAPTAAALPPPGTPTINSKEVDIEAIFFEADISKLNSHGININYILKNTWQNISPFSPTTPNAVINAGTQGIGTSISVPGQLSLSGSYNVNNFATLSALFGVLQSDNYGKILGSPEVTVRSGEQGFVQVGTNFFVTTRDFAGNTIQQQYNTGIIVTVTPKVYDQDSIQFVSLNLNLQNSSLGGSQQTGLTIANEQATTKVLLLNGEQTTVGGLYSTSQTTLREGIPVLKDLPWWVLGIRYLTGDDQTTVQTKELIILIKATVLPTLKQRFEALQSSGPQPQKTLGEQLRELEERMQQLAPSIGK